MRRMRTRLKHRRTLYDWKDWSYRFVRDQWRFTIHLTSTTSPMMSAMSRYTSAAQHDSEGLYFPHSCAGRPKMKWDHYLKTFFQQHFPHRGSEHWLCVIKSVSCMELEPLFIEFSFRDNDSS